MLRRFLIGSLVITVVAAAATAASTLLFFDRTVAKFHHVNTGRELTPVLSGNPQTILVVGSDRRYGDKKKRIKSRSDTIMLVRIDPGRGVALLSIPRDLKVQIPGYGTDKINVAYALGGPKLTIKVVRQLTGLAINHYVDVDFRGFRQAVDTIGCVHVDVDRRYFNDNSGLPFGERYATINSKPGYQKMCGRRALDYVRYRHTDSDIVRAARQQDFLRQARQQLSTGRLVRKNQELIDIFARNTASDISSAGALRRLLRLALGVIDRPITQVKFHGRLGKSYVNASDRQIKVAVRQFLYVKGAKGPLSKERQRTPNARRKKKSGGGKVKLIDAAVTGREQGNLAKSKLKFPVYYPRRLVPGSSFADAPRTYAIKSGDGRRRGAYKMVISTGFVGEYYGVQGTSWREPPILGSPSQTRKVGGRKLMLFFNGNRLRLVSWRTKRAVYWISNTLTQTLSKREMLGIARSLTRVS